MIIAVDLVRDSAYQSGCNNHAADLINRACVSSPMLVRYTMAGTSYECGTDDCDNRTPTHAATQDCLYFIGRDSSRSIYRLERAGAHDLVRDLNRVAAGLAAHNRLSHQRRAICRYNQ